MTEQPQDHTAGYYSTGQLPDYCRGLDGKAYRRRPLTEEDRSYIVGRCHYERHDRGLSVRQIQAELADDGWRVSIGAIAGYLKWHCDRCSGGTDGTPEQLPFGGTT